MSQNSLTLPTTGTVSGLAMTQNTNNALDTLNTLASGTSAPSSPEAGQLWHDTTNNLLKIRSLDNTTWIPYLQLNEAAYGSIPYLTSQISGTVNRIVNAGMLIDQVNEGASYTVSTSNVFGYTVDQWEAVCLSGTASGITAQRVTDCPAGFSNSLKITVGTGASSVGSTDYLALVQPIEANNINDFNLGTASAIPFSLSFWVKSSVTGTFSVALGNTSGGNRQYVASFSIASAGAWQKVTLQNIPGDQSGTWATGTSAGLNLFFTIAAGSNYTTSTLNAWQGGYYLAANTQTNSVLTTSGATFQVTGVQLNAGVFSLPYEKRSMQQEIILCERYYAKTFTAGTAVAQNAGGNGALCTIQGYGASAGNQGSIDWRFRVPLRASPTIVTYNTGATNAQFRNITRGTDCSGVSTNIASANNVNFLFTTASGAVSGDTNIIHLTASARM